MSTGTPAVTVHQLGGDRLGIEIRGHRLFTDQPVEDGGDDTAPTPTELFIASLAACVAYYAERFLRRHQLSTQGLAVTARWTWGSSPTRVAGVALKVDAPGVPAANREAFTRVIDHCTIHNTLRQPPEVNFEVHTAKAVSAA
jgi:putative redox protein